MPAFRSMRLSMPQPGAGVFGPIRKRPFTFAVILPTILAAIYLFLIAAPQYYSEARFVLRGQQRGSAGLLGEALQSAGFRAASEDAASVKDYLLSHDAVQALRERMDLVAIFRRPEADPLLRLWWQNPTTERLLDYYRRQVTAQIDSNSGITELRVRSFRPLDSLEVSRQLLQLSEELVNQMNRRISEDAIRIARIEVQRAEARVAEATTAITAFRQREQALDPSRSATIAVEAIGRMEAEAARLRAELQQLQTFARPNNPQIQNLRNRIEGLDNQIAEERRRLSAVGTGVTEQIAAFERLRLEAEFAGRQLTAATASLERATAEAQRQQLFLLRVVEPNLAERSLFPKPFLGTVYVFAALTLVYGLVWLVVAGVREHAQ
ncbi:MAG: capsule biosynthesis protein [Acetobacteraceae bacterium]|nr:capsule biosynthesis protein [Acetobacteraceae bacterium]